MIYTVSFRLQLRNIVSLKLDFGKWHFYEIKDSFVEVLLLKMYSVYLPFSLGFYHYKMSFLESVLFENLFESLF